MIYTPSRLIHWQDNTKIAVTGAGIEPIVQEYVLNTYTRFDDFKVEVVDAYWAKTERYWAAVRAAWAETAASKGGIAIEEEAQTGTVISARLLTLGDEIADDQIPEADAIAQARQLIRENTRALGGG